MKRLLLISSAVGLCLAAPAFAQYSSDQEQLNKQKAAPPSSSAPAAQSQDRQRSNQQQPDQSGQAQQRPATGSSSPSAQAPSSQDPSGRAQTQQQPSSGAPASSSAQAPASSGQAQSPAADQKQRGQAQDQRDPSPDRTKAQAPADPQQQDRTKAQAPADQQQQRSATDRNQPAASGQAQGRQQDMQRQDRRQDARTSRDRSSASLNINETQRTRIAATFSSLNVRPVNVKFRVATGVVVPRTVALHIVPASIVEIAPQFRGFSYFATGDQIVIVEPRRKTIVAVLPAGGAARAQAPAAGRASFTDQHREVIRSRASSLRSTATTGSGSARIVVEQEVPATVELEEFPVEIVTEVPVVRSYRYFRQDNDVFVVDPVQRRVIEIIR